MTQCLPPRTQALPWLGVSFGYGLAVNLIRDVFAAIAPTLADLGVRRGPRRSLFVPGERGDTISIGPQSMPTGVPAKAEFMVNISRHLVPWTACRHDISL